MLFKYLYVLFSDKYRNGIDSGLQIRQTSSLGFSNPFLGIVVAIENNAFMVLNDFLHYSIHFCFEILSLFERSAIWLRVSATMVLIIKFGVAMDCEEPTDLNSNLLPVNAKGEFCFCRCYPSEELGVWIHRFPGFCCSVVLDYAVSISSITLVSSSPRKMDMIAGGASLAPSLWSFPAVATEKRNRSA